jgi:hypothetical protein
MELNELPETYNLPRLNDEGIEHLNRTTMNKRGRNL